MVKRVTLLGPGNIEKHYFEYLKMSKSDFEKEIDELGKVLANSDCEIDILPDKGVSLEIVKKYRLHEGKKVIATIPKSDKTFGVKHLEPYIDEMIGDKKLFDEVIDSGDWFKHDMIKGLFGNIILYLGNSSRSNLELYGAIYLFKLLSGFKKDLKISRKKIHEELLVDENFTIIYYQPFFSSEKLSSEIEKYLEDYKIKLVYVKDSYELGKILENFG